MKQILKTEIDKQTINIIIIPIISFVLFIIPPLLTFSCFIKSYTTSIKMSFLS